MGKITKSTAGLGDILALQNKIKRDSVAYYDEFQQQFSHFTASLEVFELQPSANHKAFSDLVTFLAQISHCYPEELESFPHTLKEVLRKHKTVMKPDVRLTLCKALILLRNKNVVSSMFLIELFFDLFKCQDKNLRKTLKNHIIADIKDLNHKHRNVKLNTTLQNFLASMLKDSNPSAAKAALHILVEMYKRNVWRDAKTVNTISTALFSKITKISVTALQFFVQRDEKGEIKTEIKDSDEDSSADEMQKKRANLKEMLMANKVSKKTRKKAKKLQKAVAFMKKDSRKAKNPSYNFSALHLIYDPQGLAERLFKRLEGSTDRFEVKLLNIDLISRLIGLHDLIVLNFYPWIQRYTTPHQRDVTRLLLFAAQATHSLVPPEVIEQLLRTIANNFVTERNSDEVIAVGLNAIREISSRCHLGMTETLLGDLVQYKKYKNRGVVAAARSLISLFRDTNPQLLHRRERGRLTEAGTEHEAAVFGTQPASSLIRGAEVLCKSKHKNSSGTQLGSQDQNELASDNSEENVEGIEESLEESVDDDDEESSDGQSDDSDGADSDELIDSDDSGQVAEDFDQEAISRETEKPLNDTSQKVSHAPDAAEPELPEPDLTEPSNTASRLDNFENTQVIRDTSQLGSSKQSDTVSDMNLSEQAQLMLQTKILDDDDLKKIQMEQYRRRVTFAKHGGSTRKGSGVTKLNPRKNRNRGSAAERGTEGAESEGEEESEEMVLSEEEMEEMRNESFKAMPDFESIVRVNSKRRHDKEARVASMLAGKEGREKFGRPEKRMNPFGSTTNKEKNKKKAFMLTKQKFAVTKKSKRSFRDRQIALRTALRKKQRLT